MVWILYDRWWDEHLRFENTSSIQQVVEQYSRSLPELEPYRVVELGGEDEGVCHVSPAASGTPAQNCDGQQ